MNKPSDKQVEALIKASETLAGYFAMDACRVIAEFPGGTNLVEYLDHLPVSVVRAFDDALLSITEGTMDSFDAEAEQRRKYDEAMKG